MSSNAFRSIANGNKNYFLNIRRYAERPGKTPIKQATFKVYHVDDFSVCVERITDWWQSKWPDSGVEKLSAKHLGFSKWLVLHESGKLRTEIATAKSADAIEDWPEEFPESSWVLAREWNQSGPWGWGNT